MFGGIKKTLMFPVNAAFSVLGHTGKVFTHGSDPGPEFNVEVTRREYAEAVQALEWSELAYNLRPHQTTDGSEYSKWTCISEGNTQSIVGLVGNTVVVAWRGTESPGDFLEDLMFIKNEIGSPEEGRVHRGFKMQFDAGEEPTTTAVKKLFAENKIENIVVTGHSLGGALATLYTVKMLKLYPELDTKLITFGCPRVGNKKYATDANAELMKNGVNIHNRWAHNCDMVTRNPRVGYHHTGRFCYLGSDTVMKISNDSEADLSWSRAFDERFTGWAKSGFGVVVSDHLCDSYRSSFASAGAKRGW